VKYDFAHNLYGKTQANLCLMLALLVKTQ